MFKKWLPLISLSISLVIVQKVSALNEQELSYKKRCKTFQNLNICNNLKTTNLTVSGNETVDNVTVTGNESIAGVLTLANSAIALNAGGNLLDYGYFYSGNTGAMPGVLLTPVNTTPAYTALTDDCGITVTNAGTYAVLFYLWGPDNSSWTINVNGTPVTGATFSNAYPYADTFSPATGFAVVTLPTSGQTITLSGSNLAEPQGGIPAVLAVIRIG